MTQPPEVPDPEQTPPPPPPAYGSYGAPGGYGQPTSGYGQPAPVAWEQPVPMYAAPQKSGMYQAAAIINWVVLGLLIAGTCGIGVIAAAWFIPMTIRIHKGVTDRYKHTALGICTLLFCNIISGILMLVEDGNRQSPPTV
jgi:hypothetical protein